MKKTKALELLRTEMALRNYSPSTVSNYTKYVESFLSFCQEKNAGSFIENLKSYLIRLRQFNRPPLSASTINLQRDAIGFFAAHIMNPPVDMSCIPRMKEDRTMPEPFTQDEVALIFARENNRKHLLVLQVAYYGGVRLSDIRFLRVRDIRFDRGLIHLEVGKGRKDRYATFPDILHETMRGHISGMAGNDFVFTPNGSKEPYPKRTIQKISENACLRAGIDGRSNMHRFRHSAATHMVQNGVNLRIIQEILGHASPKTTMLYTRVAAQDIANVRNALVRVECTKVS